MLICPNCNFENPDSNNFCQQCGISLNQSLCQKYGVDIPCDALEGEVCGTSNKILLWGVVVTKSQETEPIEVSSELALANVASDKTTNPEESTVNNNSAYIAKNQNFNNLFLETTKKHLDSQERYTIEKIHWKPSFLIHPHWNSVQVQVTDEYPLKPSYLKQLQQQLGELFAQLEGTANSTYLSVVESCNLAGLPTIAIPYLLLENHQPIIPQLYDAWQDEQQGIILLEDRSQWQLLHQIWSQQDLDLLQLLWSLDEIVKLWVPLSQIGCATSLLVKTNLLLDEDQSFCLQQLYMDNLDEPPQLSDLATKLNYWLSHSPQTYYEQLSPILEKTIAGTIQTIEQLREQMQQLVAPPPEESDPQIENEQIEFDDVEAEGSTLDHEEDSQSGTLSNQDVYDFMVDNELYNLDLFSIDHELEDTNAIYDSFVDDSDNDEQATALLPMDIEKIDHASCTDIGAQRDHNEDFFGTRTRVSIYENSNTTRCQVRNLYIVCDGMGGHAAGEVASSMAVETLQQYFETHWQDEFPDEATIRESILLANQTLCDINSNNSRSGSGRMGTTLVMALIQDTKLAIAHVGDSRIYRVTKRQGLQQLTVDHEVGQREINRGVEPEIAYGRPDAYQLTQALGPRDSKHLRPSIEFLDIDEDCLLLLCSDGLSDNQLLENHGESYLKPLISSSANLESGLSEVINFANNYNGHDNITAIAVRVKLKPRY